MRQKSLKKGATRREVIRHGRYHADVPLRCGELFVPEKAEEDGLTPQYAVVYLSAGSAVFSDKKYSGVRVQAGEAFQRWPLRAHHVTFAAGTHMHFIAVPAEVFSLLKSLGLGTLNQPCLRLGLEHNLVHRHAVLARELRESSPQQLAVVLTRMQQFIVDLHLYAQARRGTPAHARLVEKACLCLSADFAEKLFLPGLAEDLGVSYASFRKVFRHLTGMSPGNYRIRRRIERAQEMLWERRRIKAVAEALGYSDLYAFSAQFKKATGMSPRKYSRCLE